jgi:hypothetical protein
MAARTDGSITHSTFSTSLVAYSLTIPATCSYNARHDEQVHVGQLLRSPRASAILDQKVRLTDGKDDPLSLVREADADQNATSSEWHL